MATTLDWVKSLRADIRGDWGKGWNLRGREVDGKMVMQIDRNYEKGRFTLQTNIDWRKENKRNILKCDCWDKRIQVSKLPFFERSLWKIL